MTWGGVVRIAGGSLFLNHQERHRSPDGGVRPGVIRRNASMPIARTVALAALLLRFLPAQAPIDEATLRQRLADKLASPFLRLAPWHTDFAVAKQAAAREGKLILMHVTRSFVPCGTSIRCEREVLSAPGFSALAERVVLYCHVTAHLDAEQDSVLFTTRGSGWPHHAVLDATGRVLGTHESWREKSVQELAALVDRAQAFSKLEVDTEREIAAANRRLLQAGLEAGALDLAGARRLLASAGVLPRAEAERYAGMATDLEIGEILGRHDRFDEKQQGALGAEFYAMWWMGKRPLGRNAVRDFWGGILLHLEKAEKPDLELYREALGKLEAEFGTARGYRGFLDLRKKALEDLQRKVAESRPSSQTKARS